MFQFQQQPNYYHSNCYPYKYYYFKSYTYCVKRKPEVFAVFQGSLEYILKFCTDIGLDHHYFYHASYMFEKILRTLQDRHDKLLYQSAYFPGTMEQLQHSILDFFINERPRLYKLLNYPSHWCASNILRAIAYTAVLITVKLHACKKDGFEQKLNEHYFYTEEMYSFVYDPMRFINTLEMNFVCFDIFGSPPIYFNSSEKC